MIYDMPESVVSQENLIDSSESSSDGSDSSQSLSHSDNNNFSHGEGNISDGVNLFGQGPIPVRRAPAVYG